MKKRVIFGFVLPLGFLLSCAQNTAPSNTPKGVMSNNGLKADNALYRVSINCDDCLVGKDLDTNLWESSITEDTNGNKTYYIKRKNGDFNMPKIKSVQIDDGSKYIPAPSSYYTFSKINERVMAINIPNLEYNTIVETYTRDSSADLTVTTTQPDETLIFSFSGGLKCVDWGDGTVNQELFHTYSVAGEYKVNFIGNLRSLSFDASSSANPLADANAHIKEINIKNTISTIPVDAFNGCTSLQTVNISSSVNKIESRAFYNNPQLEKINFVGTSRFKSITGKDIIDTDTGTLILGDPDATSVDTSVKIIGQYAFANNNASTFTIPNNVEKICSHAFASCQNLTTLDLTSYSNPPTLEDDAFIDTDDNIECITLKSSTARANFNKTSWVIYNLKFDVPSARPFTIEALEELDVGLRFYWDGSNPEGYPDLYFQYNSGGSWQSASLTMTKSTTEVNHLCHLGPGDKVQIVASGTNESLCVYTESHAAICAYTTVFCYDATVGISSAKQYKVSGNIMSLLNEDFTEDSTITSEDASFSYLFASKKADTDPQKLVDASCLLLPSNVTLSCYSYMFAGCTELISAPLTLPAKTLAENCYGFMFTGCSNLQAAPMLNSTNLALACYEYMFSGCGKLESAPILPATDLCQSCYFHMFESSGIKKMPKLPAKELADGCYSNMFNGCLNLTDLSNDELPAETIKLSSYAYMFSGCTNLLKAPKICAKTLNGMGYMFYNCSNLVDPPLMSPYPKLVTASSYVQTTSMFLGCSSLKNSPNLLVDSSRDYQIKQSQFTSMFSDCSSLVNASNFIYDLSEMYPIASMAFKGTFSKCTSLTTPPRLFDNPTSNMKNFYLQCFADCKSLKISTNGDDSTKIAYIGNVKCAQMFIRAGLGSPAKGMAETDTTYYYIPQDITNYKIHVTLTNAVYVVESGTNTDIVEYYDSVPNDGFQSITYDYYTSSGFYLDESSLTTIEYDDSDLGNVEYQWIPNESKGSLVLKNIKGNITVNIEGKQA